MQTVPGAPGRLDLGGCGHGLPCWEPPGLAGTSHTGKDQPAASSLQNRPGSLERARYKVGAALGEGHSQRRETRLEAPEFQSEI